MNNNSSKQLCIIDRIRMKVEDAPQFKTLTDYCAEMTHEFGGKSIEDVIQTINIETIVDNVIQIRRNEGDNTRYRNTIDTCVYNCPRLPRKVRLV